MNKIGITAGASTPEEIVIKIENQIRGDSLMYNNENYDEFEAPAVIPILFIPLNHSIFKSFSS